VIETNSILEWMLPLRIKDFTRGILGYAKIIGFRPATSWDSAVRSTTGYSSDESVQDFLERKSSFHVAFPKTTFVSSRFMPLSLAMLRCISATPNSGTNELRVLDVGGAFGEYYHWAKKVFPELELKWDILETDLLARAARDSERNPSPINWISSLNESAPNYDIAILSSVLQYVPDPWSFLEPIANICEHLIINRFPLTTNGFDEVATQHIRTRGRKISYPTHFLDEDLALKRLNGFGDILLRWMAPEDRHIVRFKPIVGQGLLLRVRNTIDRTK